MRQDRKQQAVAVAAVVAGVALIGTSGAAFVVGWGLWAVGLAALLMAVPTMPAARPVAKVASLPAATIQDRQAA